jgi:hypothetical protein
MLDSPVAAESAGGARWNLMRFTSPLFSADSRFGYVGRRLVIDPRAEREHDH